MASPALSFGDHLRVLALRQEGANWQQIAELMGLPAERIRLVCDDGYAKKRSRKHQEANRRLREATANMSKGIGQHMVRVKPMSQLQLDEREHNQGELNARDVTATLMGDPAPSRSALAKHK